MTTNGSPLSLNIFIDALGYGVAQEHDFLPELESVRQPVRTVLGYSSGAVPTILTGALPRVHGQWSFFYWDPENSPFGWLKPLAVLPHRIAAHHRIRHQISKLVKRVHGYTGYFNLYAAPFDRLAQWNYCEKRDIFARGGLNGVPTIFDAWAWAGLNWHVSDWRRPEDENLASAEKAAADSQTDAIFVYLGGLDAALHRVGRKGAAGQLPRYSKAVRDLLAAGQGAHDDVVVSVFSDHGMADVTRTVDLQAVLRDAERDHGLAYGRDYAAVYDSTMVRLWFLRSGSRAPIMDALSATGMGEWLERSVLEASGLNFEGDRYGEAVFLVEPGIMIVPSDMGLGSVAGMHGYSEEHEDSDAVLLRNAPLSIDVARIDDLNHMMRADVGVSRVFE